MKLLIVSMDNTTYGKNVNGKIVYSRSLEVAMVEAIAKQGHEITMVVERMPHYEEGQKPENIGIIVAPVNGVIDFNTMDIILGKDSCGDEPISFLETKKIYDLAFATSISGAKIVNHVARVKKIPSVVQVLDIPKFRLSEDFPNRYGITQWRDQWQGYFEELQNADLIIANTKATERYILEDMKLTNVKVVYYGLDCDLMDSIPDPEKPEWDISFVSRLVFYKGCHFLLHVLFMLKQAGINPRTAIIGQGEDMLNLIQTKEMLELDNVFFLGPLSNEDKFKVIKASKIGVIPEFCESIGSLAPGEYMYCKKPVIAWHMDVHRDRFERTPYYVEKFNLEDMSDEIQDLLYDEDFKASEENLEKGHQFIKDHRSFHSTTKELLKIFEEILNAKIQN